MASEDEEMCTYPSDDEEPELESDGEYRDDADDEGADEGSDAIFGSRDVSTSSDAHDGQVLSEDDISVRQGRAVAEVVGILSITPEQAAVLLRAYKWNVSHATDEWFSDEEAVRKRLGLVEGPAAESSSGAGQGRDGNVLCGICFEEFEPSGTSAAPCMHRFCNACWSRYIDVAIGDGPGCLSLRCPTPECKAAVGDDMILHLADPAQKLQFRKFLLRSYVDSSTNVKWCPAPGCAFAVVMDSWRTGPSSGFGPRSTSAGRANLGSGHYMSADMECKCGHWFCWNCLEEPHRPVVCDVVKRWLVKNSAESENMNWILANSKACPKCKRPIEKNHGCMHMTCSAPCKFEFCWLCLGDWKAHSDSTGGFYACNRYEEAKKRGDLTEEDQRKERARHSLERYLHYYERWATNETSRKKAVESLHEVQERQADTLRELLGLPAAELNFLSEAWQQVVECRRVLKWTYAYGYYLEGEDEQSHRRRNLFEYLQGLADGALGGLHKCAEKDVEQFLPPKFQGSFDGEAIWQPPQKEDFMAFKSNLTRLTAVTHNFFDNLVKALESGLAEVGDVAAAAPGAGPSSSKGKGKGKEGKKKRRRFARRVGGRGGDGADDPARQDDTSGMATIDSGDEEWESGDEGDTNEAVGGGGGGGGSGGAGAGPATGGRAGAGPALGSRAGAGPASDEPEYWSCRHCTYANPTSGGSMCSMCRLPRTDA